MYLSPIADLRIYLSSFPIFSEISQILLEEDEIVKLSRPFSLKAEILND